MLLAVDIGNSNVVIAIWDETTWSHIWRFPTYPPGDVAFYEMQLSNRFLEIGIMPDFDDGIIVSSVVPLLVNPFQELLAKLTPHPVRVLHPDMIKELPFPVPKPYDIGSDLVANAFAATRKYGDALVVDFGTALSFTLAEVDAGILGVTIAPGIGTMRTALAGNTARLPEVSLVLPPSAIGKDTETAIQAGLLYGSAGLVREISNAMTKEHGKPVSLIATGGFSGVLGDFMKMFDAIDPVLTLDGLRMCHEVLAD